MADQLVNREVFADRIDAPELFQNRAQRFRLDAIHFDIVIFRLLAEQPVAHPAADEHRSPARRAHRFTHSQHFSTHRDKHNAIVTSGK